MAFATPFFIQVTCHAINERRFRFRRLCVCLSCRGIRRMRFHFWIKTFLIAQLVFFPSWTFAAMYTKTATIPPAATVMSTGTPNLAANILEVGNPGVELITAAESESRAVANVTKGLRVPTSGIISKLKSGIRGGLPGLAVEGVIAGLAAGVGWIITEGGQIQKKTEGTAVATSPGQYQWNGAPQYQSTPQAACEAIIASGSLTNTSVSVKRVSETQFLCTGTGTHPSYGLVDISDYGYRTSRVGDGCPANSTYNTDAGACLGSGKPVPLVESDLSVLDGFVQGKDGVWQRDLADEVCKNASNYEGCMVSMGATPYVTGPAVVSSPEVTTETQSQNSDGTTTQTTTKSHTDYNLGYPSSSPGTISIDPKTTTTTTTTTKDAAGNTTSTNTKTDTTTTTQPGTGTQISDGTFTDTPFPDVGPFYTQKYPDGFKGVWSKNKDSFMQSDFVTFLKGFVPTFSGSCPTFGLSFDIMANANYGYINFWSMCWIFDIIKTIMLVTAMFTCRALIFGG